MIRGVGGGERKTKKENQDNDVPTPRRSLAFTAAEQLASANSCSFNAPKIQQSSLSLNLTSFQGKEGIERSFSASCCTSDVPVCAAAPRTPRATPKTNSPRVLAIAGTCRASIGRLEAFAATVLSCWMSWLPTDDGSFVRGELGELRRADLLVSFEREARSGWVGHTHKHARICLRPVVARNETTERISVRAGSKFAALKMSQQRRPAGRDLFDRGAREK
jgi:hypothetical protein